MLAFTHAFQWSTRRRSENAYICAKVFPYEHEKHRHFQGDTFSTDSSFLFQIETYLLLETASHPGPLLEAASDTDEQPAAGLQFGPTEFASFVMSVPDISMTENCGRLPFLTYQVPASGLELEKERLSDRYRIGADI